MMQYFFRRELKGLRKAAEKGNVDAQYKLGMLLLNNYKDGSMLWEAFTHLNLAAESGSKKAKELLDKITCNYYPYASLWKYLYDIVNTQITDNEWDELAYTYLHSNLLGTFYSAPPGLFDTPMGKAFVEKIVEDREEVSSHVIAMISFSFDNPAVENEYINHIAQKVCRASLDNTDIGIAAAIFLQICLKNERWIGEGPNCIMIRIGQDQQEVLKNRMDKYIQAIADSLQKIAREDKQIKHHWKDMISLANQWRKQTGDMLDMMFTPP